MKKTLFCLVFILVALALLPCQSEIKIKTFEDLALFSRYYFKMLIILDNGIEAVENQVENNMNIGGGLETIEDQIVFIAEYNDWVLNQKYNGISYFDNTLIGKIAVRTPSINITNAYTNPFSLLPVEILEQLKNDLENYISSGPQFLVQNQILMECAQIRTACSVCMNTALRYFSLINYEALVH